jgi:hypothetical protein
MLPLIAALLVATPASPRPSLLAPDAGRPLSARLLVAQAPQETPTPPPLPPSGTVDRDARIQELTRRVGLIQRELNTLDLGWPNGTKVMAIAGYIMAPLLLLSLPLVFLSIISASEVGSDSSEPERLLTLGALCAAGGVVGLLMAVIGTVSSIQAANVKRGRAAELASERIRLEAELRELRARPDLPRTRPWEPRPTLPLLAVRF